MKPHQSTELLRVLAVIGLGLMFNVGTTAVRADLTTSIIYDTPSGSTAGAGGLPVDAIATFVIDYTTQTITITLTNREAASGMDISQSLNGVAFALSTGQSKLGYDSQTGTQAAINITKKDVETVTTGTSFAHWQVNNGVTVPVLNSSPATGIEITSFNNAGNKPTPNLISGDPTTGNSTINADGNKFLVGTTTIVLDYKGSKNLLSQDSTVSAVQFEFGTIEVTNVQGVDPPLPTPEPSTLALATMGALGLIGYGLHRRQKTR